ncbi:hypothetical protein [Parapusillimonas granuli]|uniref:Uncharacterized protein n=1 Tax=Parapusillimonas granuli TaxID=380911 RepID=A0A853FXY4_9BURK|nr:hypothetical protein [Parapusillimonas granuli]MBB5217324.1 hypothetical protein [Parapusillimonas granuli]NYT50885.1 hypothetical protein [Parapusillimonas granuli]
MTDIGQERPLAIGCLLALPRHTQATEDSNRNLHHRSGLAGLTQHGFFAAMGEGIWQLLLTDADLSKA